MKKVNNIFGIFLIIWFLLLQNTFAFSTNLNPQNLNRYSFELNNPYGYVDPDGMYVDTAIDVISIGVSLNDIRNDPKNVWHWVALGADIGTTALPLVAGGGLMVKGALKADDAVGLVKGTDKLIDGTKTYEKTVDTTSKSKKIVDFFGTPNGELVPSRTPIGRDITPHAADRMGNPPVGRFQMTPIEVDSIINQGSIKKIDNTRGTTTFIDKTQAGNPQVITSNTNNGRIVTVIKNNPER